MTTYYASIREANGLSIDLYTEGRHTKTNIMGPLAILKSHNVMEATKLLQPLNGKQHDTPWLAKYAAKEATGRLSNLGFNVIVVS